MYYIKTVAVFLVKSAILFEFLTKFTIFLSKIRHIDSLFPVY